MHACGACGVRGAAAGPYKETSVAGLAVHSTLTLTLQFQSKSANFRALNSSAVVNGTRYHLHPELVSDASDSTFLCHACTTATAKGKIPVLSIAAGVDYGDARRLNLPALTVVEKANPTHLCCSAGSARRAAATTAAATAAATERGGSGGQRST